MKRKICVLYFMMICFLTVFSQNDTIEIAYTLDDEVPEAFGLFSNEDILEISLQFDIREYTRKRSKDEYLDAVLTYYGMAEGPVVKEMRLKSRGEFRHGFCSFPPIKLNFKKTAFDRPDLENLRSVKLVTHCQSGYSEYLLKEYLIYKLYNVLTDYSFRVRLLGIKYIDTGRKNKISENYGFIIEPLDFLAERTGTVPVSSEKLSQQNVLPEMMDRMAIFNYMIGNTDWSVPGQHNCKVLVKPGLNSSSLAMIVPYDFDYTGLVNASYAVPYEPLGLESVRDRLYQGVCRSEEDLLHVLKEFSDKKDAFYRTINEFPYLKERSRKEMIHYLDSFYKNFDDPGKIVNQLLRTCKDL